MDFLPKSLSIGTPELPKVIQDGKEVVRPDVLTAVIQLAQLAQLVRIRKLEESKVPIGTKSLSFTITDTTKRLTFLQPWISFTLLNDGAGSVNIEVNDEEKLLDNCLIASGESWECDMKYPVIHTLYLKAAPGTTAAVRIKAKEGKAQ